MPQRVSECCLTSTQQCSAISWREQVNFQLCMVSFVLDQQPFYCANPQNSIGHTRHAQVEENKHNKKQKNKKMNKYGPHHKPGLNTAALEG
jgi:hypothetical protein